MDRLFDRLWVKSRSTSEGGKGRTGVAKSVVEKHNGTITVDNDGKIHGFHGDPAQAPRQQGLPSCTHRTTGIRDRRNLGVEAQPLARGFALPSPQWGVLSIHCSPWPQ